MHEIERTVMFRNPALVVRTQRPAQYLTGDRHSRHLLMANAIKAHRRGWLEIEWDAPRWHDPSQQYVLKVRPIKDPPPAWRKYVIAGSATVVTVCGLAGLAWHALTALNATALAMFLGAVAIAFSVLVARGRRMDVTVTTTTTMRVRR